MKTIEEKIAIMQAFADGKQIQIQLKNDKNWVDFPLQDPEWDWRTYDYRVKPDPKLPKTWEEFCETHPKESGEAYINMSSEIRIYKHDTYVRDARVDRNIFPNEKYANAMLALCQLIQLRDCYNEGWEPDWKSDCLKYTIQCSSDELQTWRTSGISSILAFKTEELRDKFLENFRELIEIAKPLL